MAEDAAATCKRGHRRTPENTYTYPSGKRQCKPCRLGWRAKYRATEKGRETQARYAASPKHHKNQIRYAHSKKGRASQSRHRATSKDWIRRRHHALKGAREAILVKLEALRGEEAECQTSLEYLMQMRSS